MRHVTFETDVLQRCEDGWADDRYGLDVNDCCRENVLSYGWDVESAETIVLVFTTRPTRGASSCHVGDLARAGFLALMRLTPDDRAIVENRKTLYWWPEVWG